MNKGGSVYIMANKTNSTLYTGVTSEIMYRVREHKQKKYPHSFTARYNCTKLVYFETFATIEEAIEKEKYVKGKSRRYKEQLIESENPTYSDLWEVIKDW